MNPTAYATLEENGQLDNGSNLVVQITDDGVGRSSGTVGKTYVIQTSREARFALEEDKALETLFQRLGFDAEQRDALVEGGNYNAVALDPGSSLQVLAKSADGELEEQNGFDAFGGRGIPTSAFDFRVHNPRHFVVTPRDD